jgi:hypothetical protein
VFNILSTDHKREEFTQRYHIIYLFAVHKGLDLKSNPIATAGDDLGVVFCKTQYQKWRNFTSRFLQVIYDSLMK